MDQYLAGYVTDDEETSEVQDEVKGEVNDEAKHEKTGELTDNTTNEDSEKAKAVLSAAWMLENKAFSARRFFNMAQRGGVINGAQTEQALWKALRSVAAGEDQQYANKAKAMLGRKKLTKRQVKMARRRFEESNPVLYVSQTNGTNIAINNGHMRNQTLVCKRATSQAPSSVCKRPRTEESSDDKTDDMPALDFRARLDEIIEIIESTPRDSCSGERRRTVSFRPTRQKLIFEAFSMIIVPVLQEYAAANVSTFSEKMMRATCRKPPPVEFPPTFKKGWDLARFAALMGTGAWDHTDAELASVSLKQFRLQRNAHSHYAYEPVKELTDGILR